LIIYSVIKAVLPANQAVPS